MSETIAVAPGKAPSMGTFERYLTLWVAACIVVGIGIGQLVLGVFHALGTATVAEINLPVAFCKALRRCCLAWCWIGADRSRRCC